MTVRQLIGLPSNFVHMKSHWEYHSGQAKQHHCKKRILRENNTNIEDV